MMDQHINARADFDFVTGKKPAHAYRPFEMVGRHGIEPWARGLRVRCSAS